MAIEKAVNLDTGVVANYQRVVNTYVDYDNSQSIVTVALYLDAAARGGGKVAVKTYTYTFDGAAFPFSVQAMASKDSIALAYEALKTLSAFQGSKDV